MAKLDSMQKFLVLIFVILVTVSCAKKNVKPAQQSVQNCDCAQLVKPSESPVQLPDSPKTNGEIKSTTVISTPDYALLKPANWTEVDGFAEDDLTAAWPAWLRSCSTLINKPQSHQYYPTGLVLVAHIVRCLLVLWAVFHHWLLANLAIDLAIELA